MKNQTRINKLLTALLALCVLFACMAGTAMAEDYAVVDTEAGTVTIDGTLGGKTTAEESDITALVDAIKGYVDSGITTMIVTGSEPPMIEVGSFIMPAVSEALYRLTNEDSTSAYCGTIDLILPDVTKIVDDEFNNSYAIKSITLPNVTTVGDGAFYAARFLQTITFGSVVTTIEQNSAVVFHWVGHDVEGCDLVLNCGQANEGSPYIPDFTDNTWYDTNNTFKSITLTHGDSEHTTVTDNGDGTHSFTCTVCNAAVTEAHSTTADGDRAATCASKAYCSVCESEYGEVNSEKHASENYTYTDNGDGTHNKVHECGVTVGEPEDHTIENHVCTACGAMEIVVNFDAGDFEWKTGDELLLCRVSRDNQWEDYIFTATVADDGTVTWMPDKTLYWDGTGEHRLIVSYPCTAVGWDDFVIQADQNDVEKLKEADCMNARWVGTPTTNVINFELTHRMAKVTVNYEVAENVTTEISDIEVYSNSEYCIFRDADGMPIITSVIQQLDVWVTPYLDGNQFTAFVSPDAYAADGNFIKITLSDGTDREVKMNKAVTFAEGAEYTYKVLITADGAYLVCADGCTNFTYTDNGDGTHDYGCACGYVELDNEAHTFAQNAAGKWVCACTAKAVAKVDGTYYTDFAAALANWTDGTTLTLLDSVEYDAGINLESDAARTFSGGSYTLTLTAAVINNDGTLNVTSGTITTDEWCAIYNSGTLNITGGTVSAPEANAFAVVNHSSMTLDGGAINGFSGIDSYGTAELKSGTVTASSNYALSNNGKAILSGANLTTPGNTPAIVCADDSETTITGGTLTGSDGYVILLEDGKLTITTPECSGWQVMSPIDDAAIGTDIVLPTDDYYMFVDGKAVNPLESGLFGTITYHPDHTYTYTADEETATITCACICGLDTQTAYLAAPEGTLVYDGAAHPATVEVTTNAPETMVTYALNGESVDAPINAGDYTATMTWGGKSVSVEYSITPAPVTITGLTATDRAYDGTVNVTLTGGSINGAIGNDDVKVDLSGAQAVMADANAGENKTVTFTGVKLGGTAAGNYELTAQPSGLTVTISKAQATPVSRTIQVTNDLAETYSFNLADLLPALDSSKSYGNVSYTLGSVNFTAYDYYNGGTEINGSTLTLPIASVNSSTEAQIGTITVAIESQNYTFGPAIIAVSTVNKLLPAGAPTLNPTVITYGQPLSAIALSGSMQDGSGKTVTGTFAWDAPDTVYDAGTQQAAWTFTPSDTNTYLQETGTSSITVNKADAVVTTAPTPNTLIYNGTQQAFVTAGTASGGEMQYSLDGVNYSVTIPTGMDAGEYTVWYKVVGDPNHNDSAAQSITVTISKRATEFGSFGVFNGETQTTTFTYGDTITVKAKPRQVTTFNLMRMFAAPDNNQMALFIGDTQITAPVNAVDGVYTMTYETSGKALLVGETTITAKYVGNDNLLGYAQSADIALNPKQLTIASVSAKDRIYNSDTFTVQITDAVFTGKVLETDDVTLAENTLGTLASDDVDTYTEVALPDPTKLAGEHAPYYTVVGGAKVPTNVQITEVPEDLLVKTEINENFSDADIPAELKVKFDTVAKIETELRTQITKQDSGVQGTELFDVVLMYSEDGGLTWIKAAPEHFPKNGRLPVMLPIPDGTDPDRHDYIVTHMFTSSAFGKTPGETETPAVSIAYDAKGVPMIYVEVTGLSPIMVGWTEKEIIVDLPETGDHSSMLLWLMMMGMAGVALMLLRRRARN